MLEAEIGFQIPNLGSPYLSEIEIASSLPRFSIRNRDRDRMTDDRDYFDLSLAAEITLYQSHDVLSQKCEHVRTPALQQDSKHMYHGPLFWNH